MSDTPPHPFLNIELLLMEFHGGRVTRGGKAAGWLTAGFWAGSPPPRHTLGLRKSRGQEPVREHQVVLIESRRERVPPTEQTPGEGGECKPHPPIS